MRKIAVLMTCYNRVQTTLGCLRNLFAQELPEGMSLVVWLVDDASPDGTGARVRAEFPQVHVIQSAGNLFWCKGMRLAWDEAIKSGKHDFYLWLNDDVELKRDALKNLIQDCEQVHSVVVGTFAMDATEKCLSFRARRADGGDEWPDGTAPKLADGGMNGNFVIIPRDVYEKVGPIYGGYHHAFGDYDYGEVLREHGLHFYSSSHICGVCPWQPERYLHLEGRGLVDRLKLLWHPKGYSLHDTFIYRYRHWGILRAIASVLHVVCKVIRG